MHVATLPIPKLPRRAQSFKSRSKCSSEARGCAGPPCSVPLARRSTTPPWPRRRCSQFPHDLGRTTPRETVPGAPEAVQRGAELGVPLTVKYGTARFTTFSTFTTHFFPDL